MFILSGFEHSIANMFYFSLADMWTPSAWLAELAVALGYVVGSLIIPICVKAVTALSKEK